MPRYAPMPLINRIGCLIEGLKMPLRHLFGGVVLAGLAVPASAQIFWQPPTFASTPVLSGESIGVSLPGATPDEYRANLAWQLRAGLNVMALQCQFDRTLLTENSYNAVLTNHKSELEAAFAKVNAYFKRMNKNPKAAQNALDRYGTRTYLGFSTVQGQLGFCHTGSKIVRKAIFLPRGSFTDLAVERLREFRGSLLAAGEQQFRFPPPRLNLAMVSFDPGCWDKKGRYKRECGVAS
jgi:hypothetical protein